MTSGKFEEAYKHLNEGQRKAVDTIEGPVMVVAGPGTGKTQVLALRIANILIKTDTPADGILCLTFTNSGVIAMRERLRSYIGSAASRVTVATFHSFGLNLIERFYSELNFTVAPALIDDLQSVALVDEILHSREWKHIRSRTNPSLYFHDLKSLVSILKRERVLPQDFLRDIEAEISFITTNPDNVSSRGATKGQLKSDALRKIAGLERTKETVAFYEAYEALKTERGLIDYDDVLELIVKLVEVSDEAIAHMREQYLYVLVDEHQDSSGVQNEFLAHVWGEVERPNVFVVGDDRQLIYGFGGASLSYFEGFKETFPGLALITLTDNYRSTQTILDTADSLLSSSLAHAKLVSQNADREALRIVEADYPRDEIIRAGIEIKNKISLGADPNNFAILVPKNAQVKSAARVLLDLGLPVSAGNAEKLFELPETQSLLNMLRVIASPESPEIVAPILLDPLSGIPPLAAHQYLSSHDARKLTLAKLLEEKIGLGLFPGDDAIVAWSERLSNWLTLSQKVDVYKLVQNIGDTWLLATALDHDTVVRRVEIIRTMLHLITARMESEQNLTIASFLGFIDRLVEYSTDIALATFQSDSGVKVMTMHASKGLEFEYVWIAHMDERGLAGRNRNAFVLPESIDQLIEKRDEEVIKRQIYVAITRAKKYCTISYACHGYSGGNQELAHAVADLPSELFKRESAADTESFIMKEGERTYIASDEQQKDPFLLDELTTMVAREYTKNRISVTHLNNFFECPWKWYFRNFLQLPEEEGISLQFGSVVHTVIDGLIKGTIKPTEPAITASIDLAIGKLHGIEIGTEKLIERDALPVLLNFAKNRLPQIPKKSENEQPISYTDSEFAHLKIFGKVDLIEPLGPGAVRVTDFKTGKPKSVSELEKPGNEARLSDYIRQLAMYSYLIQGTRPNVHVGESVLEFLEGDHTAKDYKYTSVITPEHIQLLREDIKEFDQSIASGAWVHRPCNYKSYGKSDARCIYCKFAEMYKK
jgi:DNA helicase-2/ATP-dependent DNA helicase PcrA